MMRAYDEIYLVKAEMTLAAMLDHAVHGMRQNASTFFEMFVASGVAALFASGDVRTIAGSSGIELAYRVMTLSGAAYERVRPRTQSGRSRESLAGQVLARVQWRTALPFEAITAAVPLNDLLALCDEEIAAARRALADAWPPVPDAPRPDYNIAGLCDTLTGRLARAGLIRSAAAPERTHPLKTARLLSGLSQSQLAALTGIPVRTIQQYEQRQKDLSKAQSAYLLRLASVLHCDPAALIEAETE